MVRLWEPAHQVALVAFTAPLAIATRLGATKLVSQTNTTHPQQPAAVPIHHLPPEILSLIFRYYLADVWLSLTYRAPIWTLMRVCTLWRNVALSNHLLWTKIDGSPRGKPSESPKQSRSVLETYLTRSNPALLDIRLNLSYHDAFRIALEIFWQNRHRWRSLSIAANADVNIHNVLKSLGSDFGYGLPNLEEINLLYDGKCGTMAALSPIPALRTLVASSTFLVKPAKDHVRSAWKLITRYHGPAFSHIGTHPFILHLMPNLEICAIRDHGVNIKMGIASARYAGVQHDLPNLRVLHLSGNKNDTCLGMMRAPQLRKYEHRGVRGECALSNFIDRSKCALTTLSVRYGPHGKCLYELIQLLPALHTLILRDNRDAPNDFEGGADSTDVPSLLSGKPAALSQLSVLKVERYRQCSYKGTHDSDSFVILVKNLIALRPLRLQRARLYVPSVDVGAAWRFIREACSSVPACVDVAAGDISSYDTDEVDIKEIAEFVN
ncbi:hypothetical protein BD626DRAFT_628991 [Schizophyllum amplum]|uniref:F-box domain-containing protein n=1 Tax=Schizophyllum amplum TaxID=97359 RepID=A0A550CJG7_9AGAR|nr:hypothetical protein BD626DRAFT_628991 [Auriculariopsis ampla]